LSFQNSLDFRNEALSTPTPKAATSWKVYGTNQTNGQLHELEYGQDYK
jgi:hypothetical protein